MARTVKLSHVDTVLGELSYPLSQDEAVRELDDVTVELADGERNLGDLVSRANEDEFDSMDDLANEINNTLPREAVGEPYQSEGEG
ncbi:DUF5789 family protein [Halomicrococcus sp. SG-WS-1]|uniref:DUF5789 family protein n=1 Tax=Halomicrococcus sp. SG-WS-1 TaxID=3439057 RepID=UPI003F793140